jgi:hypothetical protein
MGQEILKGTAFGRTKPGLKGYGFSRTNEFRKRGALARGYKT